MIKVGDWVSWTHIGSGRRTLSMSLREGVVEDISTEREPREWFHGELVNMESRELVIRATTRHDDEIDWPYLLVARAGDFDDLDIPVFAGSKHECEQYIDECLPYAMIKKKQGCERVAVTRLCVKGQVASF